MRVKVVVAYDGSQYKGFQKQTSTQQTITYAIETALQSLQIFSPITSSGRTDAGVHATGQVIHFDLPLYWNNLDKLKLNLNRKLYDITIKNISVVSNEFHARFSAKKRQYRYVFKTKKPSIFEQNYISYYPPFDIKVLIKALACFEGKHDFSHFRKTGSHTHTTIRTIFKTHYIQRGEYHFIYFEANGFLRAQVRMMINAAMLCATQNMSFSQLEEQISAHNKYTTKLAPPEGLYLARILY